jgi:uncharacterized membrane protein HdeD (DUF308 family)
MVFMHVQTSFLPTSKPGRAWRWTAGFGIFLIVVGIGALLETPAATAAAVLLLGWLLLISGIIEMVQSWQSMEWGGVFLRLFGGMLGIVTGLLFITNVIAGALACTLIFAMVLMISGVCRMVAAINSRPMRFGWMAFEGVLTFLAGLLALLQWPISGFWFLGIALGTVFIVRGWSYVLFAQAIRQAEIVASHELHAA